MPAGDYWMHVVSKGETLRIVDLEGNQAADTLFFNADDPAERYSASDTIREQGNVYLSRRHRAALRLCRPMLTITADTVGRHDTLGGACATESNTVRYALEKKSMHACRDSYLLAVAENEHYGLTKRDIGHNINFFMNVPVTPDGGLTFADGLSAPGKYVEMRAHMNVIVLISNCPQLNNPCNAYNPTPIEVLIWGEGALTACFAKFSSPIAAPSPAASSARLTRMGVASVAVYSEADRHAMHVLAGRRSGRHRPVAGSRELSQDRCHSRRREEDRRRSDSSRLRLSVREPGFRRRVRAGRASSSSARGPRTCAPSA